MFGIRVIVDRNCSQSFEHCDSSPLVPIVTLFYNCQPPCPTTMYQTSKFHISSTVLYYFLFAFLWLYVAQQIDFCCKSSSLLCPVHFFLWWKPHCIWAVCNCVVERDQCSIHLMRILSCSVKNMSRTRFSPFFTCDIIPFLQLLLISNSAQAPEVAEGESTTPRSLDDSPIVPS